MEKLKAEEEYKNEAKNKDNHSFISNLYSPFCGHMYSGMGIIFGMKQIKIILGCVFEKK